MKATSSFQGQSEATQWKVRGIVAAAVSIGARMHAAKFGRRFPFWLFDLYCGSGYNDKANCLGSPIAMYEEACRQGVSPLLHAVDIDGQSLSVLSARPQLRGRIGKDVWLHHGSNDGFWALARELVRLRERPQYAHGVVLFDPNNSVVDPALLRGFAQALPGIDIVINYSGSSIKRVTGTGVTRDDLDTLLDAAGKQHWLIRRPIGAQQWSLLIGRNVRTGDFRAIGFEHLDSVAGRDLRQTLLMTKTEIRNASGQTHLGF